MISNHLCTKNFSCFADNKGLTLVEVLVSLVIVTIGILGFWMAMPVGKGNVATMMEERTAIFLAKELMEEVQSKAYEEPDSPGSFGREEFGPRVNLDDVDDYDDWEENPPQYGDGNLLNGSGGRPDYSNFRRAVTVENVDNNDYSNTQTDGITDSKRITVIVSSTNNPKSFDDVVLKWVANREGMELLYNR